ncbi:MAG TPA: helix-turn-helix domain-containing protein [Mycobacteriales bacterium]
MLRNVAVAVCDGVSVFELGVVCEVFGIDRSDTGLPRYDFAVCAAEPGVLRSGGGFGVVAEHGLDRLAAADLVAVPHWRSVTERPPEALLQALRDVVDRGGRVMSVCSGAFVLAAAGLLDGRRATTHWKYAAQLAEHYPLVDVDPNVLYVDAGPVLTSAGTAAGIDLCLHVVREEHGPAVANAVARRMVVPPHRDGGQAQYVEAPVPLPRRDDGLADVLAWAVEHLDRPLSVDDLAARALMSPRTFARRFRAATGTTPYAWLLHQRTLHAQRLLENGLAVEEVARRAGFGSAATLREHFGRIRGTSPSAYRRSFASR